MKIVAVEQVKDSDGIPLDGKYRVTTDRKDTSKNTNVWTVVGTNAQEIKEKVEKLERSLIPEKSRTTNLEDIKSGLGL